MITVTQYLNLTNYPVKIKKKNGEVLEVEPGNGEETNKENPFIKINYLIDDKWKKLT